MDKTLYEIINPEFDFKFNGITYGCRKANIENVIQFQLKTKELTDAKIKSFDSKIASYCIYLIIKQSEQGKDVTLDYIEENTPGTIDLIEVLVELGFMSPQKSQAMKELAQKMTEISVMQNYSQQSPTELDGDQVKLEN
jgi:hypothetical protein